MRPVIEKSAIQARSSEDSKDPNVERHMRERGDSLLKQTQKMCQISFKHVLFMKAKHSTLEIKHFSQKIENHPDRHALEQDLRQNQAYNPFSPESKKMIQDVGNIELFDLLETEPKTQCTACLSYWNVGIVHCTCGHFLQKETEVNRKFVKKTMDLLSLPEYVIKKGRPHGHRYGEKAR